MLRAAEPGDEAAIEAFLARHAETSMFMRANLRDFGLQGGDAPRASRYWLAGSPIRAAFGLSTAGFITVQAPDAAPALFNAFAAAIVGQEILGIAAPPEAATAMKQALRLDETAFALFFNEPLYRLPLDALRLPPGTTTLRPPREADRPLLFKWSRAYAAELHMAPPDQLDAEANTRTENALTSGNLRLLVQDGTPVAMTAINARLPDMVQIGGVYTPPELRGRGHARRAVALHLAEARAEGVTTAILFASGPAACRAYEAIGFERIGTYTLARLKAPSIVGAPR